MIEKNKFDFENIRNLSMNDYIEGFKRFCYFFEFNYTEKEIELLKDLWVFNKLECQANQIKTMNKIMEVM